MGIDSYAERSGRERLGYQMKKLLLALLCSTAIADTTTQHFSTLLDMAYGIGSYLTCDPATYVRSKAHTAPSTAGLYFGYGFGQHYVVVQDGWILSYSCPQLAVYEVLSPAVREDGSPANTPAITYSVTVDGFITSVVACEGTTPPLCSQPAFEKK